MVIKGGYGFQKIGGSLRRYVGGRHVFSCWIRTFLLIFIITFLFTQYTFGSFSWIGNYSREKRNDNKNENLLLYTTVGKLISNKDDQSKEQLMNINTETGNIIGGAAEIQQKIKQYNNKENVINLEMYARLSNESLVVVVQTHNRIIYLKYLIESLSNAKNINEILLIFSHDVYDENINQLIQNITFCKVMQIFFPYSIETHPNEFPGNDPKDCPRDIGKARALETKCVGAEHPDKYGHYRESKYTQIKHHWWWKMNYVFNNLKITKNYTGLVTFLEEDHYVAEDFIHVINLIDQQCAKLSDCYFLGLGYHINPNKYKEFTNGDEVKTSYLTTNLGLTFNRTTFNTVISCSKQFCEYDDYNWDWSLNHIAQDCNKTILKSLIPVGPRVFHTGECGTHIHKSDCKETVIISKIQDILSNAKNKLYPTTIIVNDLFPKKANIKENGGWGDSRDHELCISMTKR